MTFENFTMDVLNKSPVPRVICECDKFEYLWGTRIMMIINIALVFFYMAIVRHSDEKYKNLRDVYEYVMFVLSFVMLFNTFYAY